MAASFEITGAIIRFGRDHGEKHIPYTGAVFCDPDGTTAVLKGATGKLRAPDIEAIAQLLIKHGFSRVRWFRVRPNGEVKRIDLSLSRWK